MDITGTVQDYGNIYDTGTEELHSTFLNNRKNHKHLTRVPSEKGTPPHALVSERVLKLVLAAHVVDRRSPKKKVCSKFSLINHLCKPSLVRDSILEENGKLKFNDSALFFSNENKSFDVEIEHITIVVLVRLINIILDL